MAGLDYMVVDAFADGPFTGNPAAVVWLDRADAMDDATRQAVAGEFNLSETAYVVPRGGDVFELRWFTPAVEVALCGHATLAAAAAVRAWGRVSGEVVRFDTRQSGRLTCTFEGELICMDFPATPPTPAPLPERAAAVLGVAGPVVCAGATAMNLTLQLPDAAQVRAARPDLATLRAWHPVGVTITATADDGRHDIVSRFFAPAAGVDEDPVTGSAHCALGPYWAALLHKCELLARQASARGGTLRVRVAGDRVELAGCATVTMVGVLRSVTTTAAR
jgi:PhzF family phenazine biosynthesis protein